MEKKFIPADFKIPYLLETDRFRLRMLSVFDIDKDLNEQYGVQGSPSLVINGVQADSGRSPAAYLTTICDAFNDIPVECESVLSSATPSPMWGWEGSGAATTAQC